MNITNLEQIALVAIAQDDFLDGLTGKDAVGKQLWADCAADNILSRTEINSSQIGGVISSLSKKGFIDFNHDGSDSTFSLTATGAAHIWPQAFDGQFPIAD